MDGVRLLPERAVGELQQAGWRDRGRAVEGDVGAGEAGVDELVGGGRAGAAVNLDADGEDHAHAQADTEQFLVNWKHGRGRHSFALCRTRTNANARLVART